MVAKSSSIIALSDTRLFETRLEAHLNKQTIFSVVNFNIEMILICNYIRSEYKYSIFILL